MSKHISYSVEWLKNHAGDSAPLLIKGHWFAPAVDFECEIWPTGDGGNNDAKFKLAINGGQVWKGEIEMHGSWEREAFIETLELILREFKDRK